MKPTPLLLYLEELTRLIALEIGLRFTRDKQRQAGFCLIMFSMTGPELTYVSNAEREDMITTLKEFIANHEAGIEDDYGIRERYSDTLGDKL
jgi:hypothetical protein